MKKHSKKQRGYALVASMAAGIVALSITSAVMLRMVGSTSQIVHRSIQDEAISLNESLMNHVLDKISDLTVQEDLDGNGKMGIYYSARDLSQYIHSNDFLDVGQASDTSLKISTPASGTLPSGYQNSKFNGSSGSTATFLNSLESNPAHSPSFWSAYKADNYSAGSNLNLGGSVGTVSGFSIQQLHSNMQSVYTIEKGSGKDKLQAQAVISVVPLATDISNTQDAVLHNAATFHNHHDVLKLRVTTYIPNMQAPKAHNTLDVIVNRPVIRPDNTDFNLNHAILMDGDVDAGNWDTTSGPCAGQTGGSGIAGNPCIDSTTSGDVHSNGHLNIGPNGHIQGKATAVGNVVVQNKPPLPDYEFQAGTGDVRETDSGITSALDNAEGSQSGVEEVPIPEFKQDNLPTTPCAGYPPSMGTTAVYANCMINGDLDLANSHYSVEFSGTVHIKGNFTNKGSVKCVGSSPCRIVIDENANTQGGAVMGNEIEALFIVRGQSATAGTTCLDLGGNVSTDGSHGTLFYVPNPNCGTHFHGNSEFFGAIVSKGQFTGSGNATSFGIQRDSDMSSLAELLDAKPTTKDQLYPKVISWKSTREKL